MILSVYRHTIETDEASARLQLQSVAIGPVVGRLRAGPVTEEAAARRGSVYTIRNQNSGSSFKEVYTIKITIDFI